MISLNFLAAADDTPLTKSFTRLESGGYDKRPYPFVSKVRSFHYSISTLDEFAECLRAHSALKHCLLKGNLKRRLVNESRAGAIDTDAPTRWVVLDLDFDEGWENVDEAIAAINPAWANVSYIFQHSASAGITSKHGLRGHVFIMLDREAQPIVLKTWLKARNLKVKELAERITLTASGMALKWPLDVTVCQNDKLIYIAPPECENFDDPLQPEGRIIVVKKEYGVGVAPALDDDITDIDEQVAEKIQELRSKAGLPRRRPKYKQHGRQYILSNPDPATVTGVRRARGFVYLNLNGGDSWGYYFPENNPDILYNFKGEPPVRLADVSPEFHQSYMQELAAQAHGEEVQPYVFREPEADVYYNVLYLPKQQRFKLFAQASSTQKLVDFMRMHGYPMPDPIEDWTVEFDPTITKVIDPKRRWANMFEPTKYILEGELNESIPPIIGKVIQSVCVDEPTMEHFLNWLAWIFQKRQKAGTAWVFHGVEGTGKGVLCTYILKPLFGHKHVLEWTMDTFEDQFNAQLETALFLCLDEFRAYDSTNKKGSQVMNRLKHYITEPIIQIRKMRANAVTKKNFINVMIFSNHCDPIGLSATDRRFNIAPAQERPLILTKEEVDVILKGGELRAFADYLRAYKVDESKVMTVIKNEARQQMAIASQHSIDRFFSALRMGDFEWLTEFVSDVATVDDMLAYQLYEDVIRDICQQAEKENEIRGTTIEFQARLSRDDIARLYSFIVGQRVTPAKFTRMCSIYRIKIGPIRKDGRTQRGIKIPFIADLEVFRLVNSQVNKEKGLKVVAGGKET